jgi:hypothetical protein
VLINRSTFDIIFLAVLIIILIIILLFILHKKRIVTVPQLQMQLVPVTPPGQYDHGEEVDMTGTDLLDIGPPPVNAAGDTISIDLVDAKGTKTAGIASAQVAADGSWKASFDVPTDAATGQATITATDTTTGATATATFTLCRT